MHCDLCNAVVHDAHYSKFNRQTGKWETTCPVCLAHIDDTLEEFDKSDNDDELDALTLAEWMEMFDE